MFHLFHLFHLFHTAARIANLAGQHLEPGFCFDSTENVTGDGMLYTTLTLPSLSKKETLCLLKIATPHRSLNALSVWINGYTCYTIIYI